MVKKQFLNIEPSKSSPPSSPTTKKRIDTQEVENNSSPVKKARAVIESHKRPLDDSIIDNELALKKSRPPKNDITLDVDTSEKQLEEDPAFNSFNYWRVPLPQLTDEEEAEALGKMT